MSNASSDALAMIKPLLPSKYVGSQAQLLYASILVEHRYYDEAGPRLEKLLDRPPEIAGAAYALLARILWEGPSLGPKELAKAETYQKKAEELLPRTAEAYYLRAMAALSIREKLDLLGEALRLDSRHYESRRLRALTYQTSRKYELLKDDALLMMHLRPSDPLGYSLRATAWKELGNYQEAVQCYDSAIRLTRTNDPQYIELNARRCAVLMRMSQYERVRADAQECLTTAPNATILQFHVFCSLTALGRWEEAGALFRRIAKSDPAAGNRLRDWSMKYVFDTLAAGSAWHPPDRQPEGPAFLPMLEAEETYRNLSAKAHRLVTNCFNGRWSPDDAKVVFSAGSQGYSGVAVYDLKSKETDLLIVPGQDPVWSPDGRYIAFIRSSVILRLSEFAAGEPKSGRTRGSIGDTEVWAMKADGTQPRRLAWGARWPSWSQDAKQLYYHSIADKMLYSIPIEDTQAQPTPLVATSLYPSVSPDGSQVACVEGTLPLVTGGTLRITSLASQSRLAEWAAPLAIWGGKWSPDGREFNFGGGNGVENRTGLWIYDLDKREAAKVLSGQIVGASWSPDKTRLVVYVGPPYYEIWIADLDPGLSTIEALGPAQTVEEHCIESIALCNRELAADPNLFASHWERTASALWINHDQASLYLQEPDRALDRESPRPATYQTHAKCILRYSALHDRLLPLALVLARKAVAQNAGCAKDIAHLLCHMGQQEQAARLWQMAQVPILEGSCPYDEGSDIYSMVGSGADIGGTVDDFHFAGKRLHGDGSITARIESIENVHELTKAGVMIRSALEPDCPNVMLLMTSSGILSFQRRPVVDWESGSTDTPPNSVQTPQWLRLIRQGNRFTALHSSDGIIWEDVLFGSDQQTTFEVTMDETVYIGLAVTSHDITKTAEAHISMSPPPAT